MAASSSVATAASRGGASREEQPTGSRGLKLRGGDGAANSVDVKGDGPVLGRAQSLRPAARAAVCRERLEMRDKWNVSEIRIQELFNTYDRDASGQLEYEEFRQLLFDFAQGRTHPVPFTFALGRTPTEQEVLSLLHLADADRNGCIGQSELQCALRTWFCYRNLDDLVLTLFAAFDADESGELDIDEVKDLLTKINRGMPVPMKEVQFIMEHGEVSKDGVFNRAELLGAIAAWYVNVDRAGTETFALVKEAVFRVARESDHSAVLGEGTKVWGALVAALHCGGGYSQVNDTESTRATGALRGEQPRAAAVTPPPACSVTTPMDTGSTDPLVHGGGEEELQSGRFAKAKPLLVEGCRKLCYVAFPFLFGGLLVVIGWQLGDNNCPHDLDGVLLWFGSLAIVLGVLAHMPTCRVCALRARIAVGVLLLLLDIVGMLWARGSKVQDHIAYCGNKAYVGHVLVYFSVFIWNIVAGGSLLYAGCHLYSKIHRLRGQDQTLQKEVAPAP